MPFVRIPDAVGLGRLHDVALFKRMALQFFTGGALLGGGVSFCGLSREELGFHPFLTLSLPAQNAFPLGEEVSDALMVAPAIHQSAQPARQPIMLDDLAVNLLH